MFDPDSFFFITCRSSAVGCCQVIPPSPPSPFGNEKNEYKFKLQNLAITTTPKVNE